MSRKATILIILIVFVGWLLVRAYSATRPTISNNAASSGLIVD